MVNGFLTGGTSGISEGISTITSAVGDIVTLVTGNTILLILCIAAPVLGVGIATFKKLRG